MKIAIIDYGAGNTQSVQFALDRLNCDSVLTNDTGVLKRADAVIFPGVGHAAPVMENLKKMGLDVAIKELKQPVLGICLGMQLMCEHSEEGDTNGLGVFDVKVKRILGNVKSPQMGWNSTTGNSGKLFNHISENSYFYFVHTYYVPQNKHTIALVDYGLNFSAALQKDNFYACQFHPEKSGDIGEQILKNFIQLCE
jgi:imidazole glycerol-phosphate synthase subunit HisH